jgi:hypothetical protein
VTAHNAGGGERERYAPAPGFWRPSGRGAHKALRDTAETMMEVQDYKPPRPRRVHEENLPPEQRVREQAFRAGMAAQRAGRSRTSSTWHEKPRRERSTLEDCGIAAFEQGWDTAARGGS